MRTTEIIPVIHVQNLKQSRQSATNAMDAGALKLMFISAGADDHKVFGLAENWKLQYTNMWCGVNLLGSSMQEAIATRSVLDGLWTDQGPVNEAGLNVDGNWKHFRGLWFAGVAFKYRRQPEDLAAACKWAVACGVDVVTTSGPGTGMSADPMKIVQMREALGDHPLALASGVDASNIHDYKGVIDYALVASSITDRIGFFEYVNVEKLRKLIALCS